MLACRTSDHVRTRRNIRSFRSIRFSAGVSLWPVDRSRLSMESNRLAERRVRYRTILQCQMAWQARRARILAGYARNARKKEPRS